MEARFGRVVLVHDWLTGMRGGEKCLERLALRWPDAPLCTLFHLPGTVSPAIEDREILTTRLQHLPRKDRLYRYLLPFFPRIARWNVPACDLLFSLSHCVAKSAQAPEGVPHVCYCFTPMRYAWHMRDSYFGGGRLGRLSGLFVDRILARLRDWDRQTAQGVTRFIAISETIRQRIRECYDRDSAVVYPPVDTDFYRPSAQTRENFYLVVSAFAPYKRIDLAIQACARLRRHLIIIGTGQDARRLRSLAGPQTTFLGWQSDASIRDHLRRCKALLFPGEEDFGIVPVEAQACGTPVIALGRGGALETIQSQDTGREPTGVFFPRQSVESLLEAMRQFERHARWFSPRAARANALRFQTSAFEDGIAAQLRGLDAAPRRQAA